jgi:tetratricopeptide (TPR) repeat protein
VSPLRTLLVLTSLLACGAAATAAPGIEINANCSETAKRLVDRAWAAQPMDQGPKNTANPAGAEALYLQALTDSPRCLRALRLATELLMRDGRFSRASEFNDRLLQSFPADPVGLSTKASLFVELKHDYQGALDIQKKLLEMQGPENGAWYYRIAQTYSLMNNADQSLKYLGLAMAIDKAWGDSGNAQREPAFANLRKDPRFRALVKGH